MALTFFCFIWLGRVNIIIYYSCLFCIFVSRSVWIVLFIRFWDFFFFFFQSLIYIYLFIYFYLAGYFFEVLALFWLRWGAELVQGDFAAAAVVVLRASPILSLIPSNASSLPEESHHLLPNGLDAGSSLTADTITNPSPRSWGYFDFPAFSSSSQQCFPPFFYDRHFWKQT